MLRQYIKHRPGKADMDIEKKRHQVYQCQGKGKGGREGKHAVKGQVGGRGKKKKVQPQILLESGEKGSWVEEVDHRNVTSSHKKEKATGAWREKTCFLWVKEQRPR